MMKKAGIIVVSIILVILAGMVVIRWHTKSFSPFEVVKHKEILQVEYCRPYKKGRKIFGELVQYGEVWRTGANDATLFSCESAIYFGEQEVEPGQYSLWTIPSPDSWEVILNSETGQWGVDMNGQPNRDPELDVAKASVMVIRPPQSFEQFTITFEEMRNEIELVMVWDTTMVVVPMRLK